MSRQVIVQPGAKVALYENAIWWADHRDLGQALKWLEGFEAALAKLANEAERHPRIHENDLFIWANKYHQLLYGLGNRRTHRAVYRFDDERVYVVAIRHLHQRDLTLDDLQ